MVPGLCGANARQPGAPGYGAAMAFAATAERSPQIVVWAPAQSTPRSNRRGPFLSARVP